MGIQGLHKEIKPYVKSIHLRNYRGKRIGIDAFAWLHRGSISCALQLCTNQTPWKDAGADSPWVVFCLRMLEMLHNCGAVPVVVFDGCKLPAKNITSEKRRQRKEAALALGHELLSQGNPVDAEKKFTQAVDITPEMAQELIHKLRELNIEYVVAPYEADAQLAFLASLPPNEGGVEAVITEDGDLVAYGCRKLLFKCDLNGNAQELCALAMYAGAPSLVASASGVTTATGTQNRQLQNMNSNPTNNTSVNGVGVNGKAVIKAKGGGKGVKTAKIVCFKDWTLEMVRGTCVLAGCDFLPGVHGVQFKTAYGIVAPFVNDPSCKMMQSPLTAMMEHKRWKEVTTEEYAQQAQRAFFTFTHACVYDRRHGKCVRLSPLSEELRQLSEEERRYMGPHLEDTLAQGIATGMINPRTLQPYPPSSIPRPMPQQAQQASQTTTTTTPAAAAAAVPAMSWVNAAQRESQRQEYGLGPFPRHIVEQRQRQQQALQAQTKSFFKHTGGSNHSHSNNHVLMSSNSASQPLKPPTTTTTTTTSMGHPRHHVPSQTGTGAPALPAGSVQDLLSMYTAATALVNSSLVTAPAPASVVLNTNNNINNNSLGNKPEWHSGGNGNPFARWKRAAETLKSSQITPPRVYTTTNQPQQIQQQQQLEQIQYQSPPAVAAIVGARPVDVDTGDIGNGSDRIHSNANTNNAAHQSPLEDEIYDDIEIDLTWDEAELENTTSSEKKERRCSASAAGMLRTTDVDKSLGGISMLRAEMSAMHATTNSIQYTSNTKGYYSTGAGEEVTSPLKTLKKTSTLIAPHPYTSIKQGGGYQNRPTNTDSRHIHSQSHIQQPGKRKKSTGNGSKKKSASVVVVPETARISHFFKKIAAPSTR